MPTNTQSILQSNRTTYTIQRPLTENDIFLSAVQGLPPPTALRGPAYEYSVVLEPKTDGGMVAGGTHPSQPNDSYVTIGGSEAEYRLKAPVQGGNIKITAINVAQVTTSVSDMSASFPESQLTTSVAEISILRYSLEEFVGGQPSACYIDFAVVVAGSTEEKTTADTTEMKVAVRNPMGAITSTCKTPETDLAGDLTVAVNKLPK